MNAENFPETQEIPDEPNEILLKICFEYPFLSNKEFEDYTIKAREVINSSDLNELEKIEGIVKILNNPHAGVFEVKDPNKYVSGREKVARPDRMPSSELVDGVNVLKLPSLSGIKFDDIENEFLKYPYSEALIIDVRGNGGGNESPAIEFAEKYLLKPGSHFVGTIMEKGEEEWIESHRIYHEGTDNYYNKPIIVLTDSNVFSSCEKFVATLRAGTECIIIGTETRGGSAYPTENFIEIENKKYCVKIPRWRYILPGETEPLETTKIKPDIKYIKSDIVDYAIKMIKEVEKNKGNKPN